MKPPKALFVTGTDTGVGKTLIASALVAAFARRGLKTVGMKPVASGCQPTAAGLRNDDALSLMAHSNVAAPYELVNPYAFEPAIAPHIAAAEAGVSIELSTLTNAFHQLSALADVVAIEGAGGWLTPLGPGTTLADFTASLGTAVETKVVLVVGLRLGCINHALLTAQSIEAAGLQLAGWVANTLSSGMERAAENVRSLEERLAAPLLGLIPFDASLTPPQAAGLLKL